VAINEIPWNAQNDRRRLSEIRVRWVKPTKEGPILVGFTHPTKAKRRFGYGFKTPHSLQAVAVEVKPMLTSDPVRAARARFGTGLLKVLQPHRKPIIMKAVTLVPHRAGLPATAGIW
jgi:hypothetical protein